MNEFTRDWRMCKTRGIQVLYQYMKVMIFSVVIVLRAKIERFSNNGEYLILGNSPNYLGYQTRTVPRTV